VSMARRFVAAASRGGGATSRIRSLRRAGCILALSLAAAACPDRSTTVVVGGKNFTEQRILGEIVAQAIEGAGLRADRRLDLGGTFVCDSAIRAGEIDVYVEYTGTALGAVLKDTSAPVSPAATLAKVRAAYEPAGLAWTAPLGFDNTFALVVRGDEQSRTISDSIERAKTWHAAFGYEFQQRADGYPALQRTYGLAFADIRTMDLGLLYHALGDRQADVVVGSATDAAISRFGFRVLEDDRHAFPPYEAVPVVRRDALEKFPALGAALEKLGGAIDVPTMRHLNEAVDVAHRSPADVAREFLARAGQ
jgi:osmoprotectant transport system substrate-binding protein